MVEDVAGRLRPSEEGANDGSAAVPNTIDPTISAVATTSTTAIHAQNTATTNFETTSRPRCTGRIRR